MSNDDPTTLEALPGATGADDAAATNQQGASGATDDDTVVLSKKDYAALQAQRDRANNDKSDLTDTILSIQERQEAIDKREAINDFLTDNKDKYPDLTPDDLSSVTSPTELEAVAAKQQRRLEDVVQKRLLSVQKVDQPQFTPQEKADKLKALAANPTKGSFAEMVELRSS